MKELTICTADDNLITCVPNQFIDEYMNKASGDYVKVYLYLLRLNTSVSGTFSISNIASHLQFTENDIERALLYWEKLSLVQLTRDEAGLLTGVRILSIPHITSSVEEDIIQPLPYEDEETPRKTTEDVRTLLFVAQKLIRRPLSQTESEKIIFWYDDLDMPVDLIEYLIGYCIDSGHASLNYMNKIALAWADSGVRTVKEAKNNSKIHSELYYSVIKAFGINGRSLGDKELSYIDKWSNDYKMPLNLIVEACNRTIEHAHSPSFKYADSIISSWHTAGASSLGDIARLDEAHNSTVAASVKTVYTPQKQAQPKRASYNRFKNFNEREYDDDFWDKLEMKLRR